MQYRPMTKITGAVLAAAVATTALLGGCGYLRQSKDNYDMYRAPATAQAQILNPEAGKNRKVVAGLDGPAAAKVNESYAKSFEHETPKSVSETYTGLEGIAH